jgi:SAM-dependent methyltransferase
MKARESGMPPQDLWESLLDVGLILDSFGFAEGPIAELGCGYGTFTVPLAQRVAGPVYAFDIDQQMLAHTRSRAERAGVRDVELRERDVIANRSGLADGACDAGLLFNILHGESPIEMLREMARVVRPGGFVAVIHWRTDIETPRGPPAEIRPEPMQVVQWAADAGGFEPGAAPFALAPWHYGIKLMRAQAV